MAKIGFTVGGISFSGEGDDAWLEKQLDKIIEKASELIKIAPIQVDTSGGTGGSNTIQKVKINEAIAAQTLSNFLKSKSVTEVPCYSYLASC